MLKALYSPGGVDRNEAVPLSFIAYEIGSKVLVLSFSLFLPLLVDHQGNAAFGDGAGKLIWSYANVAISIVTISLYLCVLGLMDYGRMKRKTVINASLTCAFMMISFVFSFVPSAVVLSAFLVVVGKTSQRIADVALESLIDAAVANPNEAHSLTSRAQASGFVGIIIFLVFVALPLVALCFYCFSPEGLSTEWSTLIVPNIAVGIWSLVFMLYMHRLMPTNLGEGIPLVLEGESRCGKTCSTVSMLVTALLRGLNEQWSNVRYTAALPDLRWLFVSYIFLNGAASTASSMAAILAINVLKVPLWVLGAGGFVGLITALIGLAIYRRLTLAEIISVKTVLVINCIGLAVACVTALKIKENWELIAFMGLCGSQLGSFSSFSRSLVSTMVPSSHQSRLFSLFELVKDGTAWIGPLAISQLLEVHGDRYYRVIVIYVCLAMLGIGIPMFFTTVDAQRGREARERLDKYSPKETAKYQLNDSNHDNPEI